MRAVVLILVLVFLAGCAGSGQEGVITSLEVSCPPAYTLEPCQEVALVQGEDALFAFLLGEAVPDDLPSKRLGLVEGLAVSLRSRDERVVMDDLEGKLFAPRVNGTGREVCSRFGFESEPLSLPVSYCDLILHEWFLEEGWEVLPEEVCRGGLSEKCLMRRVSGFPNTEVKPVFCDTLPERFGMAGRHCYGEFLESALRTFPLPERDAFCKESLRREWCEDAFFFYAPACGMIGADWLRVSCEEAYYGDALLKAASLNNDCLFLLEEGKAQDALPACNKALELSGGSDPLILDSKGQVLEALGRKEEARSVY
ncbi:MAG: tetratricopeptide repeat protein, partial [Nitrosarchaeum sp.]|nr:tetratricopeptide repeat protein [Nitrosarchaeum sp.]